MEEIREIWRNGVKINVKKEQGVNIGYKLLIYDRLDYSLVNFGLLLLVCEQR